MAPAAIAGLRALAVGGVLYWLVTQALAAFPPSDDGVLYLVVDIAFQKNNYTIIVGKPLMRARSERI